MLVALFSLLPLVAALPQNGNGAPAVSPSIASPAPSSSASTCPVLSNGSGSPSNSVPGVFANGSTYYTPVQFPAHKPAYAEKLNPNLASFSIEMDRWPEWAGEAVGQPNEFVNKALRHLSERTGQGQYLRVGANSEDRANLDLSVTILEADFPPPTPTVPSPEATHLTIGRDFYALSGNLPEGTRYQWGVNFHDQNKTETLAQVSHLLESFYGSQSGPSREKGHELQLLELGNEPSNYFNRIYGGGQNLSRYAPFDLTWDVKNYTDTWVDYTLAVLDNFDLHETTLTPGSTSMHGWALGEMWSVKAHLASGLLDNPRIREVVKEYNNHQYLGSFVGAATRNQPGVLMNKSLVRANATLKAGEIKAAREAGMEFFIGEGNSYSNHGIPESSNTAESVIWVVDWLMYHASMGMQRFHFHNGLGFYYSLLQPVPLSLDNRDDGLKIDDRPHTMPIYNGFLIVNELIGTSGESHVASLGINEVDLAAFGIWEYGKLVRAVVINSKPWTLQSTGERHNYNVVLRGLDDNGVKETTVRWFVPDTIESKTNITWAGQDWQTASGDPEGEIEEFTLADHTFKSPASSIAFFTFKY